MADIHCDGKPCSVQKQATLDSNLLLQAGWTQKHLKKEWILTSISIYIYIHHFCLSWNKNTWDGDDNIKYDMTVAMIDSSNTWLTQWSAPSEGGWFQHISTSKPPISGGVADGYPPVGRKNQPSGPWLPSTYHDWEWLESQPSKSSKWWLGDCEKLLALPCFTTSMFLWHVRPRHHWAPLGASISLSLLFLSLLSQHLSGITRRLENRNYALGADIEIDSDVLWCAKKKKLINI